ncbi:hepatocyte nuclear factor 3-beta isoform X2 [Phlebotomus argentipes]|uniref:hepatocyte nuclear factor 3-beta isoform X2 n=1 Tax=Phlebotomus argentipes TaxID=94469 RepID=UPI0028935299|nr:hepatocyte nuclear factor 3-beta isoform X2 [Phlebotomus argentipes]
MDSGPIMDFYISDSMQDMLDIDIRSEVATVVGGASEFSSLINYDLPSLDLDSNDNDGEISWLGGPKWSAGSDIYADVGACVNPNSVMPVISSSVFTASPRNQLNLNTSVNLANGCSPASPKEKKSHLTFSPNPIKIPQVKDTTQTTTVNGVKVSTMNASRIEAVKKDLSDEMKHTEKPNGKHHQIMPQITTTNGGILKKMSGNTIELAVGIGGLTFANNNTGSIAKLKQNGTIKSSLANGNIIVQKRERESSPQHQQQNGIHSHSHAFGGGAINGHTKLLQKSIVVTANGHPRTLANGTNLIATSTPGQTKIKIKSTGMEFPKPAYSYSCLIAMALKNSRSGSLPVSEIYSFMCEHFPYFKTAPNGWKNSVRHNLSLNKCFEKIEKPTTNGGQRKGCLWAMNPSKISKMDEEVQKWSRKDPLAIRKAMVFPENLEALERGEMKHGHSGESDIENEGHSESEEHSDSEAEAEPESCDDDVEADFDVEVADLYDEIDIEDSKELLSLSHSFVDDSGEVLPTHKRARLDVNYSITPATPNSFGLSHIQSGQHLTTSTPQPSHNRRKMQLVNRIA